MIRSSSISLLAVALVLAMVPSPQAAEGAQGLLYDLRPYNETDKALADAYAELQGPGPAISALRSTLEGPTPSMRADEALVGHWIVASALVTQGEIDAALPHLHALDAQGSSLIDPLIAPLTERLREAKRHAEAAQWGLAHIHTGEAMRQHCVKAAALHKTLGTEAVALQRVEEILSRSLAIKTRRTLSLLAAELEDSLGQRDEAVARLRRLWWETSSTEIRRKAASRLKAMKAKPTEIEELAEIAFETRAKDAKAVRRRLKRQLRKTRNVMAKRVIIWARALIAGLDKKTRLDSLEVVAKYTKKLMGTPAEPWALVGHARALRRLNRDVEAAQVYEDMATRFATHPLSAHALVEGAGLYRAKGYPTEADALYRRAAALRQHGTPEREALWRVGFGDLMRGDYDAASASLRRLIVGYGQERDGVGTTWTERAQYWLASAEAKRGKHDEALTLYRELVHRFPLGWYALMAEQRIDELGGTSRAIAEETKGAFAGVKVVRQRALDHPVALLRLGDQDAAMALLKSLFLAGQLPGSGRALLAALYREAGEAKKASSVMRRHGVLAERPGPANAATYTDLFPFRFGELIQTESTLAGVSPALMSGIIYVESRFNPKAKSGAGAIGLAQLMPGTARRVSKRLYGKPVKPRALRRAKTNVAIGAALMRRLMNRFKDHSAPALAAYTAGHGAATSWLRKRGHLPMDAWVETIPYDQTRRYVMRVSSMTQVYHHLYGVRGPLPSLRLQLPATLGSFDGPDKGGSTPDASQPKAKP